MKQFFSKEINQEKSREMRIMYKTNEPKLSKWFIIYQFIYIALCVLCRIFEFGIHEKSLMLILSGVSISAICIVALKRLRKKQYGYMGAFIIFMLVAVNALRWCFDNGF